VVDLNFMKLVLAEAERSFPDVPVGALLVNSEGKMVAKASNRRVRDKDPLGHAELIVLREAAKDTGDWRLDGYTLYVTLEPCAMCAAAISDARVSRVVFGAFDELLGAAGSRYDILRDPLHSGVVEVLGGVMENECSKLLKDFFEGKRQ
jgi:tRNA(adenine34) deaminase